MQDALCSNQLSLALKIVTEAKKSGLMVATAESCSGGMIAACITSIPGSSAVFDRGLVVYSNAAKVELLGVEPKLLDAVGAASNEVAIAMAEGLLRHCYANIAISVTGELGPVPATDKNVGHVYIAVCLRGNLAKSHFIDCSGSETRHAMRDLVVTKALNILLEHIMLYCHIR